MGSDELGLGIGRRRHRARGCRQSHVGPRQSSSQGHPQDHQLRNRGCSMHLHTASSQGRRDLRSGRPDTRRLVFCEVPRENAHDLQRRPLVVSHRVTRHCRNTGSGSECAGTAGRRLPDVAFPGCGPESFGVQRRESELVALDRPADLAQLSRHGNCRKRECHGGCRAEHRLLVDGRWTLGGLWWSWYAVSANGAGGSANDGLFVHLRFVVGGSAQLRRRPQQRGIQSNRNDHLDRELAGHGCRGRWCAPPATYEFDGSGSGGASRISRNSRLAAEPGSGTRVHHVDARSVKDESAGRGPPLCRERVSTPSRRRGRFDRIGHVLRCDLHEHLRACWQPSGSSSPGTRYSSGTCDQPGRPCCGQDLLLGRFGSDLCPRSQSGRGANGGRIDSSGDSAQQDRVGCPSRSGSG